MGASRHLGVEFDPADDSVLLKIESVTERDVALYYCASMRRGSLHFGNGTKIIISGGEGSGPPDCVFCCVHLTFVSLLCVVVCTLALCCFVRQMLKKKPQEEEEEGLPVTSG
ncbi:hypothetical protein SKAU_G00421130 [Synaphobranchus kaupii]|uniref:Immunoglobulin V-set domain-containing protein n=1 Tax=Synaphobranchus kaupii TaxID=118154 RepID=A0A9Q1E6T0_SYNKA|nr:hypothetical protein SKAU_G00421130 [Synaphobranchus kaupii]